MMCIRIAQVDFCKPVCDLNSNSKQTNTNEIQLGKTSNWIGIQYFNWELMTNWRRKILQRLCEKRDDGVKEYGKIRLNVCMHTLVHERKNDWLLPGPVETFTLHAERNRLPLFRLIFRPFIFTSSVLMENDNPEQGALLDRFRAPVSV